MENATGVSLGELIDFCARCVALGIPEFTKVRAVSSEQQSLIVIVAETQTSSPNVANSVDAEYGTIIDGGVVIEIPGED